MKLDWQATPIAPRNEAARKAVLVVEDGTVFRGRGLGAFGQALAGCGKTQSFAGME